MWFDFRGSLRKLLCHYALQQWRMKEALLFLCKNKICRHSLLFRVVSTCFSAAALSSHSIASIAPYGTQSQEHSLCLLLSKSSRLEYTYRSVSGCPTLCGVCSCNILERIKWMRWCVLSHGEWSRELTLVKPAISRDLWQCELCGSCLQLWAVIVNQLVFDFSQHKNAKDSVHVHHFSCKEASCQRVWSKRGMLLWVLNPGMRVNQTDSGTQLIFKPLTLNLIWFAKLDVFFSMIRCFVPGYIDRVLHKKPTIPYMLWHMCECNDAFTMLLVLRTYSQSTTCTHAHSKIQRHSASEASLKVCNFLVFLIAFSFAFPLRCWMSSGKRCCVAVLRGIRTGEFAHCL